MSKYVLSVHVEFRVMVIMDRQQVSERRAMENKHKSGFEKWKLKEAAEKETAKLPKIGSFFKKKDEIASTSCSTEQEPNKTFANTSTSTPSNTTGDGENEVQEDVLEPGPIATTAITSLHEYPTDSGHFSEKKCQTLYCV